MEDIEILEKNIDLLLQKLFESIDQITAFLHIPNIPHIPLIFV